MRTAAVILVLLLLTAACASREPAPPGTPDPTPGVPTTTVTTTATAATPTAAKPVPRVADLYVADHTAPCTGVAPMTCLLVREDPNADWEYHYEGIEGFDYEPGFFYHLRVEITPVENPPADGSSLSWRLLEIVSKTPA